MEKINISQLEKVLKMFINNLNIGGILILGPMGIGKSTFVKEFSEKNKYGFIEFRVAYIYDTSDLVYFLPNKENNNILLIKPDIVRKLEEESEKHERVIFFIDEITQAKPVAQRLLMELLTERRIVSFPIPKNVTIVLAGNVESDSFNLEDLDPIIVNRLVVVRLAEDIESFRKYGLENGFNINLLTFLKDNVEVFGKTITEENITFKVSARALEKVSRILNSIDITNSEELTTAKILISGLISKSISDMLFTHIQKIVATPSYKLLQKVLSMSVNEFLKQKKKICEELSQMKINDIYYILEYTYGQFKGEWIKSVDKAKLVVLCLEMLKQEIEAQNNNIVKEMIASFLSKEIIESIMKIDLPKYDDRIKEYSRMINEHKTNIINSTEDVETKYEKIGELSFGEAISVMTKLLSEKDASYVNVKEFLLNQFTKIQHTVVLQELNRKQ